MELFYSTQLAIPLYQVGLLLFLSSFSLFIGKTKVALVINYLFVLYWGYWLNREVVLGSGIPQLDLFTACYFGFGVLIVILALIGFMNATAR
ncbi:MAG: hypothetical protein H8E10_13390 [Desulfobacterales bacterium]|nr:hypothetical protein [Desulfobacterales bacterium]MBL7173719.1 hypothetical protein [Desulfobacteraceae bacterium]